MINKIFITVTLCVLLKNCHAQFEKKTNIIGFQFGAYYHSRDSTFFNPPPQYNRRVLIDKGSNGKLFYMRNLGKNQSIGIALSFQKQEYDLSKDYFFAYYNITIGAMLLHRYWIPINKSGLNFYAQSKIGYHRFWQDGFAGTGPNHIPVNYWGNRYAYALEPGITYKLHKHVWLDLAWRNAFNIFYQKQTREVSALSTPLGSWIDWGIEKQGLNMGNLQLGINIIF